MWSTLRRKNMFYLFTVICFLLSLSNYKQTCSILHHKWIKQKQLSQPVPLLRLVITSWTNLMINYVLDKKKMGSNQHKKSLFSLPHDLQMALLYSESGLGSTAPLAAIGLTLVLVFSCKNVSNVKLQVTDVIKTAIQLRHIGLHTMRTNQPTCGRGPIVPPSRGTILHNHPMRSLQWAELWAVSGIFWLTAVMKCVSPWWRPCAVAESQLSTCVSKCACTDRRPCE